MTAEVRHIRTAAEQGLVDAFAKVKARLPGETILAMREAAFEAFEAGGLPHRRVEEWKYTDLRALMREAKPLAGVPDAAARQAARDAGAALGSVARRRIVIVDGTFAPELSDLAGLDPGLTIRPLAEALGKSDGETVRHVGRVLPVEDPALALNIAFMNDGAVIQVADGAVIERPIHLAFVTTGAAASFTRSLVVVGKRAKLTLIESHEGADALDYQVNNALELVAGDDAAVEHIKMMLDGDGALHVSTLMASFGRNVTFNDFSFASGSAVTRNQLFLRFDGEGSKADIRGATLARGEQHIDNTLVADHARGHCTGREFFRSVLDGESRSVFQGKIIVRQHSQKTDSKMMSNALLLSESAEADNKPELEIFADDVVCGHGATAGALDEELLFYLKARGIPQKEAEALMIQAFVGEAAEGIQHESVREVVMERTRQWLAERG
ncbi:MAG TPA: Fe-S cluster assembly protein SufD [Pseudorhodoplanes sp.]|jgi:Fe-S cluster assembly protein SufD|nr:Fe-S cluster assembly protein SufD [Pseudorhodoplanes sp.]